MAPVCITPAELGVPTAAHGVATPVLVAHPVPAILSPANMSSSNVDSPPLLAESNASLSPLYRKLGALRSRLAQSLRLSVPMYRISKVTFEVRLRVTERVRFWTDGARKLGSNAFKSPVRSVMGITVPFACGRKVGWTGIRLGLATSCSRLK